jgi:hypothetical protein
MSSVPVTEQTITAALRQLPTDRWRQVLAFIDSLQPTSAVANPGASGQRWTAKELRKLPPAERDAILAQQATALVDEYRNNSALTDFEAFGNEDLYVDSSDSKAG